METEQLRIGNYLLNDGVVVKADGRTIFDLWSGTSKNYELIPITEEWLQRFGLHYGTEIGPYFYYFNYPMPMTLCRKQLVGDKSHQFLANVEFVHDLQNIIHALTGEELTLNT